MLTVCILEFVYLNRTQFIYRKTKCANCGVLSRNAHSYPLAAGLTMFCVILKLFNILCICITNYYEMCITMSFEAPGCKHKRTSCASLNDGLRWSPSNLVRNCMFLTLLRILTTRSCMRSSPALAPSSALRCVSLSMPREVAMFPSPSGIKT